MKTVLQLLFFIVLLQSFPAISAVCVDAKDLGDARVVYRQESNQLKISASGQSLDSILSRITAQTGIRFIGNAGRCDRLRMDFDFLELHSALARVLSGRSYVVQDADSRQAMRVWILPTGNENGPTDAAIMRDEFYRQLSGSASVEELADLIRQMEQGQ